MIKPTGLSPEPRKETSREERASLLERASGIFGLDRLAPAKLRSELPAANAKITAEPASPPPPLPMPSARTADQLAVRFSEPHHAISRAHLAEQGFIDPDGGASALLEEFRIIKRQILATAEDEGTPRSRRILLCSPHSGEGKTFCAVNLAIAMAGERGKEVVLVDADFAKPSIMEAFGLEAGAGFMDALADPSLTIEGLVVGTDIPGLWLLPAGKRTGRDSEFLASERTWEILNRLTRSAPERVIIFDSPPALAASPAAELAKHVGQALLIARADHTARAALEDALDLISACPDIRLLLNDATFSPSGRTFGSYYG